MVVVQRVCALCGVWCDVVGDCCCDVVMCCDVFVCVCYGVCLCVFCD